MIPELQKVIFFTQSKSLSQILPQEKRINRDKSNTEILQD